MLKFETLKLGDIISESPYSKVLEIKEHSVVLLDTQGNTTEIGRSYVEKIHHSADQFDETLEMTRTELIEVFLSYPRIACTVCFQKKDNPKTKKAIKEEIDKTIKIGKDLLKKDPSKMEHFINTLANSPILPYIPGEIRTMKGFHESRQDGNGRIKFIDMEDDNKEKSVDPRTIEFFIANNIKHVRKK